MAVTQPVLTVHGELGADWDALAAGASHTAGSRWLSLVGPRLVGESTFRLVAGASTLVAMRGRLLAAPTGHRRLDPYPILSGASADLGLAACGPHPWHGVPAQDVFPCLVMMFPDYDAFAVGPGAHDSATLRRFVRELRGWAFARGARSMAFLYLTPAAAALVEVLRAEGLTVVPLATRAELEVRWDDLAGYLATLPRKRRGSVRREVRHLAEAGVGVEDRGLRADEPRLVALRCNLVAKYGGTADPEREAGWFDRLRARYGPGDVTVFTAATAGAEPLAFCLFVRTGDRWTALLTGADQESPHARFGYFATAFYAPAVGAARRGIRHISYGLGSQDAKRSRGCALLPLLGAAGPVVPSSGPDPEPAEEEGRPRWCASTS